MLTDHWPLFGLRVRTTRLELRLPTTEELAELGALSARGVHDRAVMPFTTAWTDLPPVERARSVMQFHWRCLGDWKPGKWNLPLVAFADGVVVGTQEVSARDFGTLREVSTGSWVGREHQGQGIGTEIRAAVLEFAFAGLGAVIARSSAFSDNAASNGVSRKLGYETDGSERLVVRGQAVTSRRLLLTRERWEAGPRPEVALDGLEPCLPLLGLPIPQPTR